MPATGFGVSLAKFQHGDAAAGEQARQFRQYAAIGIDAVRAAIQPADAGS